MHCVIIDKSYARRRAARRRGPPTGNRLTSDGTRRRPTAARSERRSTAANAEGGRALFGLDVVEIDLAGQDTSLGWQLLSGHTVDSWHGALSTGYIDVTLTRVQPTIRRWQKSAREADVIDGAVQRLTGDHKLLTARRQNAVGNSGTTDDVVWLRIRKRW